MEARHAKNRKAADLPLRDDVVGELRQWVDVLRAGLNEGPSVTTRESRDTEADLPLFTIDKADKRWFDLDLKLAGLDRRDDRGRVIDIHSLLGTYATMLAKAGVPLRVAQERVRHSDAKLTANVYQDVGVFDLHVSVNSTPLDSIDIGAAEDNQPHEFAPAFAQKPGQMGQTESARGNSDMTNSGRMSDPKLGPNPGNNDKTRPEKE